MYDDQLARLATLETSVAVGPFLRIAFDFNKCLTATRPIAECMRQWAHGLYASDGSGELPGAAVLQVWFVKLSGGTELIYPALVAKAGWLAKERRI